LGLGDIGALAGKPVMEGKGILFKRFADIDVFDIELDTKDKEKFVEAVALMEPTFGGINLEDISAPDCFYIETELKKRMKIPVFHDDQHGTAIISGAALLNAVEIAGKDISKMKVVFSGTGAAGTSCAKHYIALGVKKENLIMCDRKGVIYKGRPDIFGTPKEEFAIETNLRTLAEALNGADCFAGLSTGGIVSKEMVKSMAENPIIFAMANPDPEIGYKDAKATNPDCIMATGRSDYPNQVNNVLGFPFIFRGALDVCAVDINEEMKLAATLALADLTKKNVPESVLKAYNADKIEFGKDYIIPKPFDPRVLVDVSLAVAKAAVNSGVAKEPISDWTEYERKLEKLAEKIQE
jgi:malate dehydrogenase (oxaloacetate-decarboxylating)(NADP+)